MKKGETSDDTTDDITVPPIEPTLETDILLREPEAANKETSLIERINSGNSYDFIQFFDSLDLRENQFNFTQEEVAALLKRYMLAAINSVPHSEKIEGEMERYRRYEEALPEFLIAHPLTAWGRESDEKENFMDQLLKAAVEYVKTNKNDLPESLEAAEVLLSGELLQDSHQVKTEVLFGAATEVTWIPELNYAKWDENILRKIKDGFISHVQYQISFDYGGNFIHFFKKTVADAIGDGNELQVAKLIEFVRHVGLRAASEGWSENAARTILGCLLESAHLVDNYFLRERIIQAYSQVREQAVTSGREYKEADSLGLVRHDMTGYISAKEEELLGKVQPANGNLLANFTYAQLAPGYVGIYGPGGTLQRFQTMEDFTSRSYADRENPEDLPFFSSHIKRDDPNFEVRNENVQDMLLMLSLPFRKQVEEDFGVDLGETDLRVQNQFLTYLKRSSVDEATKMAEYARAYGKNFFTAFLSLEDQQSIGASIIRICEKFPHEVAEKIFAKYADLVAASEKVRDYLRTNFSKELEENAGLEESVVLALLKKGKETLETSGGESATEEKVVARLDDVDAELQLFANSFKELLKGGVAAQLEQFPGTELQEIRGGKIDQETKDQMFLISDRNWKTRPHMYEAIMAGFKKSLDDPNTTFHLIINGGKVIAFFRMDKKGSEEQYFGSVNVRPEAQGYALAPALLQQMFIKEADGQLVVAHCYPWDKVSDQYIGDAGFVATKLIDYIQPSFEIVRDGRPDARASYRFAGKPYEELLGESLHHPELIHSYVFMEDPIANPEEPENKRFIQDMEVLLDGSHVVSNFRIHNRKEGGVTVLVAVEPKSSVEQVLPESNYTQTTPGASGQSERLR